MITLAVSDGRPAEVAGGPEYQKYFIPLSGSLCPSGGRLAGGGDLLSAPLSLATWPVTGRVTGDRLRPPPFNMVLTGGNTTQEEKQAQREMCFVLRVRRTKSAVLRVPL